MRIPSYKLEEIKEETLEELSFKQYSVEKEIRVDVYKGVRTFGLVLVGGASNQQTTGDSSIYVSKVLEGGLAEVDGRIMPGDRIAAIKQYLEDGDAYTFNFDENGTTTHEDAKQILRRCKGRVALFVVRKDEVLSTHNEAGNAFSQTIPFGNTSETETTNSSGSHSLNSNKSNEKNDRMDQNNRQNFLESNDYSCDTSKSDTTNLTCNSLSSSNSSSKETCNKSEASSIKLISLTSLKYSRSSPKFISQSSNGCSLDYRDMAKYGIRPSTALCRNMLQADFNNIKDHRIKKTWLSNNMSAMSIQEDEEEELYPSSLPHIDHRFEIDMEQRVL